MWLHFASLRKFHDTELLFGRFQVSIYGFPSIPRTIDANMSGVTLSPHSSSRVSGRFIVVLLCCCIVVLLYCFIVVLLYCCIVVLLYCCIVILLYCCIFVLL